VVQTTQANSNYEKHCKPEDKHGKGQLHSSTFGDTRQVQINPSLQKKDNLQHSQTASK
jgi:hypothetical protein